MRSSKKRSRSSQNRPRTLGNIINRVFDSSGPEGKVRGTPQQIIEKFQMLARDAQLSNDRVAAENFLQHAEHYTRMLAEATREMAAEQEARQQQYQQSGGQGGQNSGQGSQGGGGQNGNQNGNQNGSQGGQPQRSDRPDRGDRQDRGDRPERQERPDNRSDNRSDNRPERRPEYQRDDRDLASIEQPRIADVIDLDTGEDSGLIETPESAAGSTARARADTTPVSATASDSGERTASRRPRSPRKPKADPNQGDAPPKEAAE